MTISLDQIESQIADQRALPPLHLWDPPLSGDIDIVIHNNGEWWHEGSPIRRQQLVKLFASILRREPDEEYYLVTPVEKWRIRVEDLPLLIVDFEIEHAKTDSQQIIVRTNVDRQYLLGSQYPLCVTVNEDLGNKAQPDAAVHQQMIPRVCLQYHLEARFDRPAYYRLVDAAEIYGDCLEVMSDGCRFTIGKIELP